MRSHYSQTVRLVRGKQKRFHYRMRSHYSQTVATPGAAGLIVSLPYEITLLANTKPVWEGNISVSLPYELTLLANQLAV